MKTVVEVMGNNRGHWVGDGFPVRSLFSYHHKPEDVSPFLLLDFAGPHNFEPNDGAPRGVGSHPHRGFETVTIVDEGEVTHADSTGGGGTIGRGEVQWMTAGAGIVHEEFHSRGFSKSGGPFRVIQLWVNLPAKDKMTPPAYQAITADAIPEVAFDGGRARVIAGNFRGTAGPARTYTPVNLWDIALDADADLTLDLPEGHTALVAVRSGHVTVAGEGIGEAQIARLTREGTGVTLHADGKASVLVLTGEPIDEPVVGYGPFVMNSETEIREAIDDFNSGRFGLIPA